MKTTLSDEVIDIMDNAIKEILERTEGYKSARDYLIKGVCHSCVLALTNSKYKKEEKIASVIRQTERYINDIDQAIEDYNQCVGK